MTTTQMNRLRDLAVQARSVVGLGDAALIRELGSLALVCLGDYETQTPTIDDVAREPGEAAKT